MSKKNLDKPLTIRDIQEVLIPAMEAVFATKKELAEFKGEFREFKNEMTGFKNEMTGFKNEMKGFKNEMNKFKNDAYDFQDKVLKDLDILLTEKAVGDYQMEKHRKMWQVVIPALKAKKVLTTMQLRKIKILRAF